MRALNHLITPVAIAWFAASGGLGAESPDWVQAMRRVHAESQGTRGVFVHLGDSITYSMAYFAPLQYAGEARMSPAARDALQLLNGYMQPECYRWKGPDKGNYSGQAAAWGLENIDTWLATLKPEVALIMFGSNDIRRTTLEAHERALRGLVQRCLDNGVVVILSTIPPMHGYDEQVLAAVEAQRRIATELKVPLIDFYAHVMLRRPQDWDGSLPQFQTFSQWEVPTIISQDGVHPSNPQPWRRDYTEEGLCRNGNILRTYLTLKAYAEVIRVVLQEQPPSDTSRTILGANPPAPPDLPRITTAVTTDTPAPSPARDWHPQAPPLPAPRGPIRLATTVDELYQAVEQIAPGGTVLVADGWYRMPQTLVIKTDNVTLRGKSGDRTKAVLDFSTSRHHEGVAISNCSGVTIADLTVQNVRQNGIKINSNLDVDRVTIYNVIGHNVWQRHIKGPKVPDQAGQPAFVEDCRVQYCLFYNDRPKRRGDEPWEDSDARFGFNYVGGIDVMSAKGWVVSDNVFTGIHGQTGEARGAIFFWHNGTDCVIERNIIADCDTGICLGNSSARSEQRHANGFIVRNNFVVRCHECNILADHTRNCRIQHNSVHDPQTRNGRLLRIVHANDGLVANNNIFSGPRIVVELSEGPIDVRNNLIRNVTNYFAAPDEGNLRLNAQAVDAIDKATPDRSVLDDIDQQPRDPQPDLGADERLR